MPVGVPGINQQARRIDLEDLPSARNSFTPFNDLADGWLADRQRPPFRASISQTFAELQASVNQRISCSGCVMAWNTRAGGAAT